MFHKFIKNKILTGLLLLSSLSYGGSVHSDKSDKVDDTIPDKTHQVAQNDTININGMKFYIPPEEPSWEERKAKAVLMYWERKDPITGQIIVTKYPDTLKVKEETHPEQYTKEDLDLLLGPGRARLYPEYTQVKVNNYQPQRKITPTVSFPKNVSPVIDSSVSSTNSTPVVQDTPKDELDKILERLEKEEQTASKEKPKDISEHSTTNLPTNTTLERTSQQDVQELLDLLNTEKANTTNSTPVASIPTNNVSDTQNSTSDLMTEVLRKIEEKEGKKFLPTPSGTDMIQQTLDDLTKIDKNSNRGGQKDLQELLDLLNTEKTNTTNDTPHKIPVVEKDETTVKSNEYATTMAGAEEVEELLNLLKNEQGNSSKSNISAKVSQQVTTSQMTTDKPQDRKNKSYNPPNVGYAIPLFLAPLAMVLIPDIKKKKKEEVKTESSNAPQTENQKPDEQNTQEIKEKRDALAERLHAIRTIEDIKNQRRVLSKQMRQAKKNNDVVKIQEITDRRKKLTLKRREKCLYMTNPQMAIIKEKRRLLTKRMTIARRQKDIQTMNAITQERLALKNQVKELNASIRNFDYIKNRQSFLKESTIALIRSHNRQNTI